MEQYETNYNEDQKKDVKEINTSKILGIMEKELMI